MAKTTKQGTPRPYPWFAIKILIGFAVPVQAAGIALAFKGNDVRYQLEYSHICGQNAYSITANTISLFSTFIVLIALLLQVRRRYIKRTLALVALTILFAIVSLLVVASSIDIFCGWQF
jgi:hypothetical protein